MEDKLQAYLLETLPQAEQWVEKMEAQAEADYIPIMDPVSMHFLMQLIRITKPKRILEIGTAIGYSALRMLEAYPQAEIVTIEKDAERFNIAQEQITKRNKTEQITVIHGDALEVLRNFSKTEPFDLIFIDAAKGQNQAFFELVSPLLRSEGTIVTDNVLFRGYIADPGDVPPRYRNMIQKIKVFNDWLGTLSDFTTSIVPIGDGLAISHKGRQQGRVDHGE